LKMKPAGFDYEARYNDQASLWKVARAVLAQLLYVLFFKRLTLLSKRALIEIGCVVTSLVVGWLSRACTVAKRCILGL